MDDNTAIHITEESPYQETSYTARFSFDPNSITMANNNAHYIFCGFMDASTVILWLEFRYYSSNYQLRIGLLDDAGQWSTSSWSTINDAPHTIELDWLAASEAGADDGELSLWVDNGQAASLAGGDNDTRRIDLARLGAITGIDSGTRGTYYFDEFVSRREASSGMRSPLDQRLGAAVRNGLSAPTPVEPDLLVNLGSCPGQQL